MSLEFESYKSWNIQVRDFDTSTKGFAVSNILIVERGPNPNLSIFWAQLCYYS
jgi:hypothetical protein